MSVKRWGSKDAVYERQFEKVAERSSRCPGDQREARNKCRRNSLGDENWKMLALCAESSHFKLISFLCETRLGRCYRLRGQLYRADLAQRLPSRLPNAVQPKTNCIPPNQTRAIWSARNLATNLNHGQHFISHIRFDQLQPIDSALFDGRINKKATRCCPVQI